MTSSPNNATAPRGGFADLGPRVASAVVLVAAAAFTLYVGGDTFAFFWLAAGCAVNWEWQGLIDSERRLQRTLAGGASVAVAAALARFDYVAAAVAAIIAFAALTAALASPQRRIWAGAGVIYASALTLSVCLLRQSADYGALAIGFLFAVVWGTDIFAYFGGRLIGGPKLWPRVSAGKTWSGTARLAGPPLGLSSRGSQPVATSRCCRLSRSPCLFRRCPSSATCLNRRSKENSTSRIRATSFPAMAA